MKRTAVRVFIVGSFLVALAVFVALPGAAQEAGQKKQKKEDPLTRSQRAEINYVLVIEEGEDLEGLLAEPVEGLEEKILTAIEQEHDITLKRTSMVKTEKCLHDLLAGIPHMAKVSAGHKIVRLKVTLHSGTSRSSIWSAWEERKLETPVLGITFYYENGAVPPSEIVCQGRRYD